ncbi:MAG TPA: glycerophosphodiester phosphodiesterase [Candidatus Dormibacteraeota bacterium]
MLWIAHGGLAGDLPAGAPDRECLSALRARRVDRVELDVAVTATGELVVIHEAQVAPGALVEAGSLVSLRRHLPGLLTLAEAVEVLGDKALLLDLKGSAAAPLGSWLKRRPELQAGAAVCTDDLAALLILRHAAPAVERWRTLPTTGVGRGQRRRRALAVAGRRRLPDRLPGLVAEVAASALCCDHLVVTARLCAVAHRLGVPVGAWTVDRPATARRVAAAGVDLITTNAPEGMRAALREG